MKREVHSYQMAHDQSKINWDAQEAALQTEKVVLYMHVSGRFFLCDKYVSVCGCVCLRVMYV